MKPNTRNQYVRTNTDHYNIHHSLYQNAVMKIKKRIMPLKHDGDLKTISGWTKNYRVSMPEGATLGYFFGRSVIEAILDQPGCAGIRIYNAIDSDGVKQVVL